MNFTTNTGTFGIIKVLDFVRHLMLKIVINNKTLHSGNGISPCTQAKLQYCKTLQTYCVYMCICVIIYVCVCVCERQRERDSAHARVCISPCY